jgi:hypothetical protein
MNVQRSPIGEASPKGWISRSDGKSHLLPVLILGWTIAIVTALVCGDSLAGAAGRATMVAIGALMMWAATYAFFREKGLSLLSTLMLFLIMPPMLREPSGDIEYSIKSSTCFFLLLWLASLIRRMLWGR